MYPQWLYGKLFTVLGLLWVCECLHHLVHGDHTAGCRLGVELGFRLCGVVNLGRGCLIFYIFVWKDSTLNQASKNLVNSRREGSVTMMELKVG